ncbi:hypothetical protein AAFF_G00370170 [Aldrovandia affinis]|uniref:Uncharacterized protein n=1 Tax=Aldrovandia affinis TaxID=143900 RepID=A0AAD7SGM2_9TELE|nr:hypothetical protein AAFF_G00370170 [Aldrovandia affinis]
MRAHWPVWSVKVRVGPDKGMPVCTLAAPFSEPCRGREGYSRFSEGGSCSLTSPVWAYHGDSGAVIWPRCRTRPCQLSAKHGAYPRLWICVPVPTLRTGREARLIRPALMAPGPAVLNIPLPVGRAKLLFTG